MKINILMATLGIATLAATPLFAQSQYPSSGQSPGMTQSPGAGPSGGAVHQRTTHHRPMSRSADLSSTTVKRVQQKLAQNGIKAGPVDGKLGPKTRTAVKEFQQKNGIKANGRLNRQTLAALGLQARHGQSGASSSMSPGSSSNMDSGSSSGTLPKSSSGSAGGKMPR